MPMTLKRTMKRQIPAIVCRYSKDYEAQVTQRSSDLHEWMLGYHGKDSGPVSGRLVDGGGLAEGIRCALGFETATPAAGGHREARDEERVARKCRFPEDLLGHKDGLGVFLNPDEGKEIMTHFASFVVGLKKKGDGLTVDEERALRGFFDSPAVSPRFVRRLLDEYGDESVRVVFLLKGDLPEYWLDYLLRSRKGHFYRKRYPGSGRDMKVPSWGIKKIWLVALGVGSGRKVRRECQIAYGQEKRTVPTLFSRKIWLFPPMVGRIQ